MTDILITDCDMGPADLEREVLAAAGLELTHLTCQTAADVVEQANAHQARGLLVQYAPIGRAVFEGLPATAGGCALRRRAGQVGWHRLWSEATVVSLHAPLTTERRGDGAHGRQRCRG